MLSYQHIYHAGNLADVHKHAFMAAILEYLTRKDKPLSYFETHAGRALYDLDAPEALKTAEAAKGIAQLQDQFANRPYGAVLHKIQSQHGAAAYPGSPLIAAELLRATDRIHLCELHPKEHAALEYAMSPFNAQCYQRDGFETAHSLLPFTPRRGVMLIDPSYEIKSDYTAIPNHIRKYARAWNVGVIVLWYPILSSGVHQHMLGTLAQNHPQALCHEVRFAPARHGHGMVGSGLFILNPPYICQDEGRNLSRIFAPL